MIKLSDVRLTEKDKLRMADCFRLGDVVRAEVVSLVNAPGGEGGGGRRSSSSIEMRRDEVVAVAVVLETEMEQDPESTPDDDQG